jgi:hypothetical protein
MLLIKTVFSLLLAVSFALSEVSPGFYADISESYLVSPVSAAMGGADMSIGSGASTEGTPGNLPFDSLNRVSLSYAGFYQNTFSTSMLSWSGKVTNDVGVSILAGYVYIPDIWDTRGSTSTPTGELNEAKISVYSASKVFFRAGAGRRFVLAPGIALGAGAAVNAKRTRLPETGYGIGLDAGVKTVFEKPGISVALQAQNITSSYIYWTKDFKERSFTRLRGGIGWERRLDYLYGTLRIAYTTPNMFANEGINAYSREEDGGISVEVPEQVALYDRPSLLVTQGRIGAEYTILNTVALRLGVTDGKIGFGAGLRLMNQRVGLDVAYIAHALAGTYQLAAGYSW